ncbi:MAG: calcineurin-like phosphoesterase family protein [Gracilimonas sp.]|nr:calcineurin-like phosphoesterase family protein [Gracilimonas sp.]
MTPRSFIFLLCVGFLNISQTAYAQLTASGVVFEDSNQNGSLDRGESALADVPVSNGSEVVLTNKDGRYTISIEEEDATVFVIKPAGYEFPLNRLNQPQFFYIHKPKGSPELEFKGVEPTGPLPASLNFPLYRAERTDDFSVLLFGDPQPYNRQEVDFFDRDIVAELKGAEGYEFGITLGDIVGDDLDLFEPYNESVAKIGTPWFNVYGNHDMNFDAETDQYADETFEATFGPASYSFNHGEAHFIILDDVVFPRTDGLSGYIGGFTSQQLTFIENELKYVPNDKLIVIALHIPMFTSNTPDRTFRIEDRSRLFELLKDYPNTLSISAHTHLQSFHFFDVDEGWQQLEPHVHYNVGTTGGDWWSGEFDERGIPETLMRDGTPNGYAILNISGNEYTIDYKVANSDKSDHMSIWGPKVVPQNRWHGAQLYVNYYLGNEYTKVEYKLQGRDDNWRTMNRVAEQDPFVANLRQKWDTMDQMPEQGRRPSNPVDSDHLWKVNVPNNISIGTHVIDIRVTDMFGRAFEDRFTYEVVEPTYAR